MIIDTFSSIDTFVPPYSGSKTLSPTFTLTGMMFPLWKLQQSLVKLKKNNGWSGKGFISICFDFLLIRAKSQGTHTLYQ